MEWRGDWSSESHSFTHCAQGEVGDATTATSTVYNHNNNSNNNNECLSGSATRMAEAYRRQRTSVRPGVTRVRCFPPPEENIPSASGLCPVPVECQGSKNKDEHLTPPTAITTTRCSQVNRNGRAAILRMTPQSFTTVKGRRGHWDKKQDRRLVQLAGRMMARSVQQKSVGSTQKGERKKMHRIQIYCITKAQKGQIQMRYNAVGMGPKKQQRRGDKRQVGFRIPGGSEQKKSENKGED